MLSFVVVVFAALSLSDAGDVLTLTDTDFDSRLAGLDLALVKFYAPWYIYSLFRTKCSQERHFFTNFCLLLMPCVCSRPTY